MILPAGDVPVEVQQGLFASQGCDALSAAGVECTLAVIGTGGPAKRSRGTSTGACDSALPGGEEPFRRV
eukprot:5596238-Pyramimonas_sp.AAC.1